MVNNGEVWIVCEGLGVSLSPQWEKGGNMVLPLYVIRLGEWQRGGVLLFIIAVGVEEEHSLVSVS